jgi:hypothetical protein
MTTPEHAEDATLNPDHDHVLSQETWDKVLAARSAHLESIGEPDDTHTFEVGK